MKFSIVTPSFRLSPWLKLCVASVHDQDGVEVEHIVQDAGSDDGTLDWLPHDPRVSVYVEKDGGMYEAINRGLCRATGDILAYLNCDEQYLPGALRTVEAFFRLHPDTDVVFTDTVVVGPDGSYMCSRQAITPTAAHILSTGGIHSLPCATFFRRRLLDELDNYFNPALKAQGDPDWTLRLLRQCVRMQTLKQYTSVFTDRGDNLSLSPVTAAEIRDALSRAPIHYRSLRPLILLHHWLKRLRAGHYRPAPFEYALYTRDSPSVRKTVMVRKPTSLWKSRWNDGKG
jgi:glycosyltransferase involved in cell wall biosynthesis